MTTRDQLRAILSTLTPEELRTIRAMINGKLGRRTITPEQQEKMQAARKK